MPLCFAVWYYSANLWVWPVAIGSKAVLCALFPHLIHSVEQAGTSISIVTNLGDIKLYTEQQKMAALEFTINPLAYGYSLAWYSAILSASPTFGAQRKFKLWLLGMMILIGVLIFGVCADALKSIAFDLAPPGMTYPTGFSAWQLNLLGICYQLGYLILPSVMPLLLWAYTNKHWFEKPNSDSRS